ncbi:FecR domain-containing protein [Lampropedia aestuarii]|uniref:FecR domain-containing protein n=1 Tax=Lampropedia aestuarii TaxID=2562762 RepID=UPI002468BFFF|nr:FecR domain-containing protein [Lampropedia aestuarii]MDH5855747.1 FecR domain-containing protein [Lampropedia aestuarii]
MSGVVHGGAMAAANTTESLFAPPAGAFAREVSQQATHWMVVLDDEPPASAAWHDFRQWHDAHPEHAAAWAHLQRFQARLRSGDSRGMASAQAALLCQALKAQAHKDGALQSEAGVRQRRQALKLFGALVFTGTASWQVLQRSGQWQLWVADYSTATGEQRHIELADGSVVVLNTATALNVRFSATQRLLVLEQGEIHITTAHERQAGWAKPDERPLWVQTQQGRMQALGTRFTVRQDDGHTHLGVLSGAVQALDRTGINTQIVQAGYQLRLTETALEALTPYSESDAAWTQGSIIARDMPLPQFIAQLARYRRGRLVCDASAAHLRVSGIFPVADTNKLLQALAMNLPIAVHKRTEWWVTVTARSSAS